jgi:hypothetical protein
LSLKIKITYIKHKEQHYSAYKVVTIHKYIVTRKTLTLSFALDIYNTDFLIQTEIENRSLEIERKQNECKNTIFTSSIDTSVPC